jgi:general secretion pathway protein G
MRLSSHVRANHDPLERPKHSPLRNRISTVASPSSIPGHADLARGPLDRSLRSRAWRLRKLASGGFTVIELIVAMTILMILTAAAVPVVRITIQRNKERELRRDLWEMRDAIDRYKDAADRGAFQIKVDSQGYPPDLDTLVKGVDSNGKKMRFLRRIPVDPMTGKTEWGQRSMQDDLDSDSWGGQNVFDVYTKSEGTALDGSKYKTW